MRTPIDPGGQATVLSCRAGFALARGDTGLARLLHAGAGELLERQAGEAGDAGDAEAEHLLRFLAATQFYKGGAYRKAQELANRTKQRSLPAATRCLLTPFRKDVKDRAAAGYAERTRDRAAVLRREGDHRGLLDLLRDHPYAFGPRELALLRAACCDGLGDAKATGQFREVATSLAERGEA